MYDADICMGSTVINLKAWTYDDLDLVIEIMFTLPYYQWSQVYNMFGYATKGGATC